MESEDGDLERQRLRGSWDRELTIPVGTAQWPTVDGPLGVNQEDALKYARNFFYAGFFLLPWLWFVNCVYFWPILKCRTSHPQIRPYVVRSAIGFLVYTMVLLSWALTFSIGGEPLFGSVWKHLAVYDVADTYDLFGE